MQPLTTRQHSFHQLIPQLLPGGRELIFTNQEGEMASYNLVPAHWTARSGHRIPRA
jgi:hypothetical protein